MLRIIHNQTVSGALLVDDIDDGLPNKEVHRLGSTADPKAYVRDGYANKPKQSCYVPRTQALAGFPLVQGYINLSQTQRVTFSSGKGKISKLQTAGLVTVVSFTSANVVAPVVTGAHTVSSNFVISGTTFTSVSPDTTTVTFVQGAGVTAASPAVFTQAAIVAAGGSITGTTITIPNAAFTGQTPVAGNTVTVQANEQNSNTFVST